MKDHLQIRNKLKRVFCPSAVAGCLLGMRNREQGLCRNCADAIDYSAKEITVDLTSNPTA
jgi:hypothetical protein